MNGLLKTVRMLLVLMLVVWLAGCAGTNPMVETSLTPTSAPAVAPASPAPDQTPLQAIVKALGELKNFKLFVDVRKDAADTIAMVNSPAWASVSSMDKFAALQCPTAIQEAMANFDQNLDGLSTLLLQVDAQMQGLAAGGSIEIIKTATMLKFGPSGMVGSDPKAIASVYQTAIMKQINLVRRSCAQIIPDQQIKDALNLATKAGLVAGTGGGAAPLLGMLP